MPLYSVPFALDTESDRYVDGEKKTRMVQICPVNAKSINDVRTYYGWDALHRFFDTFDETTRAYTFNDSNVIDCHVYNLGGYEFSHLWKECLRDRYEYTDAMHPKAGQWTALADDKSVYKVSVRNRAGVLMNISDDLKRFGSVSMKKAAESVRAQHPDWFPMDEVKLDSDYHDGWLNEDDPDFEAAVAYSKQDAYSQAMLARWLIENGYDKKLTAPGNGLYEALRITYDSGQWIVKDFQRAYPPLNREMQDIAERSLLGGFVYGETGTWLGTFTHLDYSSSYPYEYVYGRMFRGEVRRLDASMFKYDHILKSDRYMRWFLVSFDFEFKGSDVAMPAISGRECAGNMTGRMNHKMRTGRVERRLYTESYLEELKNHYDLSNLEVHEIWVARSQIGGFETFIRHCYETKQMLKEQGRGDSADYLVWKLYMNGGVHGKTITKTRRRRKTFFNGEVQYQEEVSDPKYCFMIGFTAMMNARERLLKHCRRALEAGYHVMMCDTDSMILNCTEAEARTLFSDWLEAGGHDMEGNLGKFEIEHDRWGNAEFDEFKCWGLKRYAEIRHIDGDRVLRKTAFAGMRDSVQSMLLDALTDGTEYVYTQPGKKTMKYGATIIEVSKRMKAECIWDDGELAIRPKSQQSIDGFVNLYRQIKDARKRGEI